MQNELDNGASLEEIFEKHQDNKFSSKKYALMVATLKDKRLIEKHKRANSILIFLMIVLTVLTAVAGYILGIEADLGSPYYWAAIAIVPLLFLYNFIKVNYQAYAIYLILSITQFPRGFEDLGEDIVADVIGISFSILLIALVWYLKAKLFPTMGFVGVKKNFEGKFIFDKSS